MTKKEEVKVIKILEELSDKLCIWHSECDCYNVEEMKKYEYKIDDFLKTYKMKNNKGELLMKHEFYIAGVKFHEAKECIDKLTVGTELNMIPDPDNKYDSNAIRLIFTGGIESYMLGYVPAKISGQVSAFLETGNFPICLVTELNPEKKPWEWIKVVIKEDDNEEESLDA